MRQPTGLGGLGKAALVRAAMFRRPFWERKTLTEMDRDEWEALCDGCGKCCLVKLQDADLPVNTPEVDYTDVACRLLDCEACRCTDYPNRREKVPDCVVLSPDNIAMLKWMPASCAYRRLSEGRGLPDWHPLITGDPESVHRARISVRGRVVPEGEVDDEDLPDHIVDWPR